MTAAESYCLFRLQPAHHSQMKSMQDGVLLNYGVLQANLALYFRLISTALIILAYEFLTVRLIQQRKSIY